MNSSLFLFYTFLFVINLAAFFCFASDKHRAYYDMPRLPEALLMVLAIAGGAYGAGCGMLLFRHKTLHRSFLIVVPLFLVLWAGLLLFLLLH